jgi:cobalt/nickel transport protein
MKTKSWPWQQVLLILVGGGIIFSPLLRPPGPSEGTDQQATQTIQTLAPQYQPWFAAPFTPSGELEGLLFLLQGIVAAGGVGYVLGRYQERFQSRIKPPPPPQEPKG